MSEREPRVTELTAISPLDGRYRDRVEDLAPFASEMALIKTRFEIEAKYLVALSKVGIVRPLKDDEQQILETLGPEMTISQAGRVKEIETTTRHDVKAVEMAFREFLAGTTLEDVIEMVHFGLTSEDVNNLSYRLLLKRAKSKVCIPALDKVVDKLVEKTQHYKSIPMLARTHGQAAVPTTLGKEIANFAVRLNRQVRKLEETRLTGKLNGAVGNYNALALAAPEVDWVVFSKKFIEDLGLEPNLFTTQINPYEDIIETLQAFQRVNGVLLDFDQDMWRYISDGWFVQELKKGEIGSSTMPQKVNPIDFENSEGNAQLANGIWDEMTRKLAVSRLQRDLSDSTTVRNIGVGLAYGLISYRSALEGLGRIRPNLGAIDKALNENWTILGEAAQTVLRRSGQKDPYSQVASLTKGQTVGKEEWIVLTEGLQVDDEERDRLESLRPETYIGYAQRLVEMALSEVAASREKKTA